jgi:dihydroneopterin aldolase
VLRGIEFVGRHGVEERERIEGRAFRAHVSVDVDALEGFHSDRISDTVDYTQISKIIEDIGTGSSCFLVERLAEKMAQACLQLEHVTRVELELYKRVSGIPGNPRWVGVCIVRER